MKRVPKSNSILSYLQKFPLLVSYARSGLINLNALARLYKKNNKKIANKLSVAAISMDLRRSIAKLSEKPLAPFNFSQHRFQLVTRNNISEIILNKTIQNRQECLKIVNDISQSKYFISIVEGEKEIVLITDHPLTDVLKNKYHTSGLGFVSINFPIELRKVPGIYAILTTALAESEISIHSFHTIGGEIIILFKEEDLYSAQEVLRRVIE